jgi:hypothetical protein
MGGRPWLGWLRGLRGPVKTVTVAHLNTKTLRIGFPRGCQANLLLQSLLDARESRIALIWACIHHRCHDLGLDFGLLADLRQRLHHLRIVHAGSDLQRRIQLLLKTVSHSCWDGFTSGLQFDNLSHTAVGELQRHIQLPLRRTSQRYAGILAPSLNRIQGLVWHTALSRVYRGSSAAKYDG